MRPTPSTGKIVGQGIKATAVRTGITRMPHFSPLSQFQRVRNLRNVQSTPTLGRQPRSANGCRHSRLVRRSHLRLVLSLSTQSTPGSMVSTSMKIFLRRSEPEHSHPVVRLTTRCPLAACPPSGSTWPPSGWHFPGGIRSTPFFGRRCDHFGK